MCRSLSVHDKKNPVIFKIPNSKIKSFNQEIVYVIE